MASDNHGTETQEEPQAQEDLGQQQASQDKPQVSGTDWEKAIAERDEKIAALEAQVAEAAKTEAQLQAQIESIQEMNASLQYAIDNQDDPATIEDIAREGFGGVLCIETGGPTPGLGCAGLVGAFACGLFPNIIPATQAELSITIANAASSDVALGAMTVIACIGVPLVLVYHVLAYRAFRGRLE